METSFSFQTYYNAKPVLVEVTRNEQRTKVDKIYGHDGKAIDITALPPPVRRRIQEEANTAVNR